MASFHSRSNSLPSQSHPMMELLKVEDHLCRIKASESTSTSASSICANLATLKDLHQGINYLIQTPSFVQVLSSEQGENWINELLEGSLRLVDLCCTCRDILYLTKESVQDLESSIRRNKLETATVIDMNAYAASRKKINKMVKKCLKNQKSFNRSSTALPSERDNNLKAIGTVLKGKESLDFSVLKSVLILLAGENERSNQRRWSLLSNFTQNRRVYSEVEQETAAEDLCFLNIHKPQKNMLKLLNSSEKMIQELEEGLESLFRSLIKTRVSLLNALSH